MIFKNATIYQLNNPIDLDELRAGIEKLPARECGALEKETAGWTDILGDSVLNFTTGYAVCLQVLEKIIPNASIDRIVNSIVKDMDRPATKKERKEIKERVITEKLPTALVKETKIYGYFDKQKNWLVIDGVSKKADHFVEALFNSELDLKISRIIDDKDKVANTMTGLVLSDTWKKVQILPNMSVQTSEDGQIKFINAQSLDDICAVIHNQGRVEAAEILVDGQASFWLHTDFTLRKISIVEEEIEAEDDRDKKTVMVADFLMQASIIQHVVNALVAEIEGDHGE